MSIIRATNRYCNEVNSNNESDSGSLGGVNMAEKRTTYKIQDVGGIGEVKIADEVVTIIAGLAATEVEGVASMGGNNQIGRAHV